MVLVNDKTSKLPLRILTYPNYGYQKQFLSTLISPSTLYKDYLLVPFKTIKSYLCTSYLRDSMKKPFFFDTTLPTKTLPINKIKTISRILPYLQHCSRSKTSLLFKKLLHPFYITIYYNTTYNLLFFYYNTLQILLLYQ